MELHVVPTARYDESLLCWDSFTYVACMLYPFHGLPWGIDHISCCT